MPHTARTTQPTARAALALQCARLDSRTGGLGSSNFEARRDACFVDSFYHARPIIARVCQDILALPVASMDHPSTAGFSGAYERLRTCLADTRQRCAVLDADSRTWIDGTVVTAYHPIISKDFLLPDLAVLYDDATSNTMPRFTQRKLSAVINTSAWLDAKEACDRFDAANTGATVPRREVTRLISCSQAGAGAFLMRLPDVSVKDSTIDSTDYRTIVQRRLGLYLTYLAVPLDESEARGAVVTQHKRLGDAAINAANCTHRHNEGMNAVFVALKNASAATSPVCLGDKGNGTSESKTEAKRRHAHLNDGHIPDIYRTGPPHILYEWKCYTPFRGKGALGNGSTRRGGAASTTDGHSFAFGSTLEYLQAKVLGQKEMGAPSDPPLNRRTGVGRVDPKRGDYTDAFEKGNIVHLLGSENTGALAPGVIHLLHVLDKSTADPQGHDSTQYGLGRASPQSFFQHHLAAVSCAIVRADALTIRNHAAYLAVALAHGVVA